MVCMMSHLLALCHVETTELFTAAVTLPYRVFFDIACGVEPKWPVFNVESSWSTAERSPRKSSISRY